MVQKYKGRLRKLKQLRAKSNTDSDNDRLDQLIEYTTEFIRDLNKINKLTNTVFTKTAGLVHTLNFQDTIP